MGNTEELQLNTCTDINTRSISIVQPSQLAGAAILFSISITWPFPK